METLLAADKQQYKKEQDKLLETVLNQRFFYPWIGYESFPSDKQLRNDSNLELYVTNQCNQKCEYCYLHKYPGIYPKDKTNPENILHNLKLIYEWMLENDYAINRLDFFSGEIWHTTLGFQILDLTYEYTTKKGLKYNDILIASNCFFVANPKTFQKIQQYIDKFKMTGHQLVFSISIDGKYIDNDDRQRNDQTLYTDEFYDTLFTFAIHNTFYFHPMISSGNIHLWPQNYQWWKEMFKKYDMMTHHIMMLEVRNNDWTDETIDLYTKFIVSLGEDYLHDYCKDNIEVLGNVIGHVRQDNVPPLEGYYPWIIGETDSFIGCSICNHLTIRVGDLAICPCHRSAYDKYLYGFLKVENDKICGIEARNPQMAIKILMGNHHTAYNQCNTCLYNHYCLKGCIGSQIETMRDPFIPIPSVCKFFKAKYSAIIQWYERIGIIKYLESINSIEPGAENVIALLRFIKRWRDEHEMAECE